MKKTTKLLCTILVCVLTFCLVPEVAQASEPDTCKHQLKFYSSEIPTCENDGSKEYYQCTLCGRYFEDENASKELTEKDIILRASEDYHYTEEEHYRTIIKPATATTDGIIGFNCVTCGKIVTTNTIPHIGNINLSFSSKTYNGKTQIPTVKIYDSKGSKLYSVNIAEEYGDYSIAIPKMNNYGKTVGRYPIVIKLTNRYKGSITKTFDITPKATSITKLSSGKKSFTAYWKKQASQTSGYQIRYSTSNSFKNAKTITISNTKTTSKKIRNLKAKKKYYVKVRTYKKTKYNGKTVNIYSSWSKVKTIKVK